MDTNPSKKVVRVEMGKGEVSQPRKRTDDTEIVSYSIAQQNDESELG